VRLPFVAERHFALVAVDHDGLCVEKSFIAGSGIARVADGSGAGKFVQNFGVKISSTSPMARWRGVRAVAGDDAGGFLAAMLERRRDRDRRVLRLRRGRKTPTTPQWSWKWSSRMICDS